GLSVGGAGVGGYNQTGGTASISGRLTVGTVGGTGMTLSGGSFSAGSLAGGGPISSSITLTVGSDGTSSSYTGLLSGGGSLVKTGGGILILAGPNSYSGGTSLNTGAIAVSADNNLGTGGLT